MKVFHKIYTWLRDVGRVIGDETLTVVRDGGVLLFFFALPLFYPIVYTLIYDPEIVTDLPVAVVDRSCSVASRDLIRKIDATQSMAVTAQAVDESEARRMLYSHEVTAYFVIDEDYARRLGRMEPAHVGVVCDMSLLLRYRAILSSLTEIQLDLVGEVTAERAASLGVSSSGSAMPVTSNQHIMGDPTQGFASFVMPGIFVMILQQSMLLGIALLGGSRREGLVRSLSSVGVVASVVGRALTYVLMYLPVTVYITMWVPEFFALPHEAQVSDVLLFMAPLLLGVAFLGQALSGFMRRRETCFVAMVFTSVIFLFLSGLSWPRYAMPAFWQRLGDLLPSTWGVEGFIRMNNNGAGMGDVSRELTAMWILTGVYMAVAIIIAKVNRRRCQG